MKASDASTRRFASARHDARTDRGRTGRRRRARRRRWRRRVVKLIAVLVAAAAVGFGLLWVTTPSAGQASMLAQLQASEHHIAYPGPPPPPRFTEALVATEDHRFYSPLDPGVDPFAVARLVVARVTGRSDQGGSTIDQQLAKMLYTPGNGSITAKFEDVALAIKLHIAYSHAQILRMYAETAYYGDHYYGLQAASCGYFGRPPAALSWPQAALLAGIVQAPTLYDPRTHPALARAREGEVFGRLVAVGDLTQQQARAQLAQPLGLVPRGQGCRG